MLSDIGEGAALIKLEGARQPLEEKIALAHGLLGDAMRRIENDMFGAIGCGEKFADLPGDVWRVMIAASDAPRVAKELNAQYWLGDWAGGLIWLAAPASADAAARIRAATAPLNGHAMLVRAAAARRAEVEVFEPLAGPLMRLTAGIKASIDPDGIFNFGRMYRGL